MNDINYAIQLIMANYDESENTTKDLYSAFGLYFSNVNEINPYPGEKCDCIKNKTYMGFETISGAFCKKCGFIFPF